jgi:hypothetical protein
MEERSLARDISFDQPNGFLSAYDMKISRIAKGKIKGK